MLAYVGGCMAWGAMKAHVLGAHAAGPFPVGLGEIAEELQYRWGGERLLAPKLGLSPEVARIAQAAFFGLVHPGHEIDAALGGYVYSRAYDDHGLLGAVAAHLAHNVGIWLGSTG